MEAQIAQEKLTLRSSAYAYVNPVGYVPTTFFELAKITASGRLGLVAKLKAVQAQQGRAA